MSVLVTGGTGFIGSALVWRLVRGDTPVMVLTRDKRRLHHLPQAKILAHEGDITQPGTLAGLSAVGGGIESVFHLAARLDYFGAKEGLVRVNVNGTRNLLDWAVRNGVKRFIFTSSIEAMGTLRREDVGADERYPCRPVSPYGVSKLRAEREALSFAATYGIRTIILRLGNVYGPGSRALILPVANAILGNEGLLRYLPAYGERYLDPVYVDDVIEGIIKASQSELDGTYVLSGNHPVTVRELFERVAGELNAGPDISGKSRVVRGYLTVRTALHRMLNRADLITYFMTGQGDRIHRAYSIEKAQRTLGYFPQVDLKEGISRTLAWAREKGLLRK